MRLFLGALAAAVACLVMVFGTIIGVAFLGTWLGWNEWVTISLCPVVLAAEVVAIALSPLLRRRR
jgi:hypothetical protein